MLMQDARLLAVAHFDAEVFSAPARVHRAGTISTEQVSARLRLLGSLDVRRVSVDGPVLGSAWALRDDVAPRDALYVVLAGRLDARVATSDARLARAVPDLVQ